MANLPTIPPFKSNIINKNATNIFDLPNGDFGNPDAIIAQAKLAYDKVSGKVERVAPLAINAFQKYFAGYLNVANIFERAAYNDYLLNAGEYNDVQDIPAEKYPETEKLGQYVGYHARLLSGLIARLGSSYTFNVYDPFTDSNKDVTAKLIWSIDSPAKLDFRNDNAIVSHVLKGDAIKNGNIFIAYEKDILDNIVAKLEQKYVAFFKGVAIPIEYVVTINMFSILSNVTLGRDGNMYFLSIMNLQGMQTIDKDDTVVEELLRVAKDTLDIVSTYNGY